MKRGEIAFRDVDLEDAGAGETAAQKDVERQIRNLLQSLSPGEPPRGRPRKTAGLRHERELLKDPVKETDAELELALERWEDDGGAFDCRSILLSKVQHT